jgi:hypothetical protein
VAVHDAARVAVRGGALRGAARAAFFAQPGAARAALTVRGGTALPRRLWATADRPGRFEADG